MKMSVTKEGMMMVLCFVFIASAASSQVSTGLVKIDTNLTGFHFTQREGDAYIYTQNGLSDLKSAKTPSAFSLMMIQNTTYESAKDLIEELIETSALEDGNTQDQFIKKDTIINSMKGYSVALRETRKGSLYHNLVFYGFILKGNEALLFISSDLDRGKYSEKFKKTFYSIRW
mgnify:CR=1 FL=1